MCVSLIPHNCHVCHNSLPKACLPSLLNKPNFILNLSPRRKGLENATVDSILERLKENLDALALTPCYSAFLTTADVPEVYMHQFWDSIQKHDTSYRFRMDKKKKFYLNLETFRDIFQICPRVHGQDFDELPTDEVIVSFFKELGHTGEIKSITDVVVDQMHQPWRTFATIINRSLSGKTSGLDKLRLSRAQILWGMYYKKNVDYVELLWEDFTYQIDNRGHKKQEKMYYPRFTKVIIHYFLTKDKTVSRRNKIGMHTSRDDYLINTLRFVSANEESQIYGARLPESMTSPEMRETKAYKTYLGYATGVTPPKKARKFKKPASPKLTTVPVSPEEPTRKSKRVKRPAKKSTNAPTAGVVIRDTPVMSLSKKKEKMTVEKRKGIELLSEVALTEEAQYEEVRKKSLRDFHKTHPSGSGIVTKIAPSAAKIKPSVTNEGTGAKPGVPDVTEEESTESEAESWGRDEDDSNNDHDSSSEGSDQESDSGDDNTQSDKEKGSDSEHETDENETGSESDQEENEEEVEDDEEKEDEFVKTPSNYKAEGDDDKGMDYTTNQFDDDVDVRLNEPVNTDEGFIQKEGTDAEMINVQQGNENLEITLNQVIEDAHVTISTVAKKTEVPVTSSSHSSNLASKFLNFSDIPHTDAEIVSLMDVHVHHEVPSNQTLTLLTVPVLVITESSLVYTFSALEKEVVDLKEDDLLNTQVTTLVDEHIDSRLGATRDEFMSYLSASITARITKQVKIQLPQILPKEVSNFSPPVIKRMVTELLEHPVLAKESSQLKSTYEAAASLTKFELKKIFIDKMDEKYPLKRSRKNKDKYEDPSAGSDRGLKKRKTSKDAELTKGPKTKESKSGSSKGTKSQSKSFGKYVHAEEPEFEVADSDMPQDQEENIGNDDEETKRKVASKRDCWLMTLAVSADKPLKTFDDLMSAPIDFSAFIMNGLKINNLTQETLLGPTFKLLKGTHTNYAELEYDFEECYKALSEKLDWNNPEGGDYPFDLTKPLPLVMSGNHQKTKVAQYDLPGIEDMVPNIWSPDICLIERIEKTKRSKNSQKPTRNERDKKKSEESAKDQKPDQPDTARKAVKVSPEEPTRKLKRVKRPAKKSTNAPTGGVVIRETPVMSLSKKKEKMTVEKRKGIDLLYEVALTEETQYEEVHKKSLRDFYKTYPCGSGTVTKLAPSAAKIIPSVTNEGIGKKPRVLDVTEEESTESEAESWGRDEDDSNNDHDSSTEGSDQESDSEENEEDVEDDEEEKDDELVKTSSNSTDDEYETNVEDKDEGDEDKGMDYTTN
ncbi:transposase, MuDR, MULE transposase domain protein [Tanacetum coccineum]